MYVNRRGGFEEGSRDPEAPQSSGDVGINIPKRIIKICVRFYG